MRARNASRPIIYGPFERELYNVYLEHRDLLKDQCIPLDELYYYMEDIVGPMDKLETALAKVDWVEFNPGERTAKFIIDENAENAVYVDKDDSEEIETLIEYLDGWEDGCELCHLLDDWEGNVKP